MAQQICNTLTDAKLQALARKRASGLIGQARLKPQDQRDIEQELILWIVDRLGSFDASQSPLEFFAKLLADQAGANLLRHRLAAKRNPHRVPISHHDADAGSFGPCYDRWHLDQKREDARLDFESLLERLSPEERDLLSEMRNSSLAAIARSKGVPPSTMRSRFQVLKRRLLVESKKNA